jgi:hypothetical protein
MTDVFSDPEKAELPQEVKEELAELEHELREGEIPRRVLRGRRIGFWRSGRLERVDNRLTMN